MCPGKITTFNALTGVAGCSLDYPVVEMPYTAFAPRMACNKSGRVLTWDKISFNLPDGLIQAAAISTNTAGETISASDVDASLTGTNTDTVCAASIQKMLLPQTGPEVLADTGADSGRITLVVIALMMLIGGSVLVTRSNR